MGVFRIARAEFIKIFKKPSVYLMGVILAAVLVLSLLFFNPIGRQNYSVTVDGVTVEKVYNKFMNDTAGEITKIKYDEIIQNNVNKINFYKEFNNRNEKLKQINEEFVIIYNDLVTQNKIANNDTKINLTFLELKNKVQNYYDEFNNTKDLKSYSAFFKHFTTLPSYSDASLNITKLYSKIEDATPSTIIDYIESNNFIDKFSKIYTDNSNFVTTSLNYYVDAISKKQSEYYKSVINNPTSSNQENFKKLKNDLATELDNLLTNLAKLNEDDQHLIFMTTKDYDELTNAVTEANSIINSFDDVSNLQKPEYQRHKEIVNSLKELDISNKIKVFTNKLIKYNVDNTTLDSLEKIIVDKIYSLRTSITASIENVKQNNNTSKQSDLDSINNYITCYRVIAQNTNSLVNDTINLEAVKVLKSSKINNYVGFEKFNIYETKENLTKTKYFINKGTFNQDYSDVFAFNRNSSNKTSAYDFMFYGMKIATLVITIFAIFLSASLMASEYDSGTIKLLAMRPFNRWKIITGKLLATMIFVFLFVLFSFIICLVAGVCMYPLINAPVLVVFNGRLAFALHPFVLMLINFLSIIAEIFFYAVIALSISTIFRSYTSAISISCILYILATSFNVLFGGYFWYAFIPFVNADLFKYMGGSFLTTQTGGLNSLFTSTLVTNANFFISLGIWAGTIFVFLLITHITFKLRDF